MKQLIVLAAIILANVALANAGGLSDKVTKAAKSVRTPAAAKASCNSKLSK